MSFITSANKVLLLGRNDMLRAAASEAPPAWHSSASAPTGVAPIRFCNLDRRNPHAARRRGDQERVSLASFADVDHRPVDGQVLHPDRWRRLLSTRGAGGAPGDRRGRDGRDLPIDAVLPDRERRNRRSPSSPTANSFTPSPDSRRPSPSTRSRSGRGNDGCSRYIPERYIASARLSPIAFTAIRTSPGPGATAASSSFEDFGTAGLVKANDASHGAPYLLTSSTIRYRALPAARCAMASLTLLSGKCSTCGVTFLRAANSSIVASRLGLPVGRAGDVLLPHDQGEGRDADRLQNGANDVQPPPRLERVRRARRPVERNVHRRDEEVEPVCRRLKPPWGSRVERTWSAPKLFASAKLSTRST